MLPKMELESKNNNENVISIRGLANVLREVNVSALLDKWGPTHTLQVYDPHSNMYAVLIIDSPLQGPSCGWIDICPDVTPLDVFYRARDATWSSSLFNVPLGGAAVGIKGDPSKVDTKKIIRSFAQRIAALTPKQYIAAPGPTIGKEEMAVFAETVGDRQAATGKPEDMDGIPYELGGMGLGIAVATETVLGMIGHQTDVSTDFSGLKIGVMGTGLIGSSVIKYMARRGGSIVSISDEDCTVHNVDGINIGQFFTDATTLGRSAHLKKCTNVKKLGPDQILSIDCDVLICTSNTACVTEDNFQSLKARCFVSGMNRSVTPLAEQLLHNKGVLVLPNILTLGGAIINSHVEYERGSAAGAFSLIETRMKEVTSHVVQQSLETGVSIRRVAQEMAQEGVLQTMEALE